MTKRFIRWWNIIEFGYFMITTTARSADNIDGGFIGSLDVVLVEALRISRWLGELLFVEL
jgi:hypothetical protein